MSSEMHNFGIMMNSYLFALGTQTHLPQKLFFLGFRLTFFANVEKCSILKRVKKKVSEISSFLGET